LPELALLAGTRVALGTGLGLLLAGTLNPAQRRAVGWSLFAVGVVSTIPLAIELLGKREVCPAGRSAERQDHTAIRPIMEIV
jgi:hypothetical protein